VTPTPAALPTEQSSSHPRPHTHFSAHARDPPFPLHHLDALATRPTARSLLSLAPAGSTRNPAQPARAGYHLALRSGDVTDHTSSPTAPGRPRQIPVPPVWR